MIQKEYFYLILYVNGAIRIQCYDAMLSAAYVRSCDYVGIFIPTNCCIADIQVELKIKLESIEHPFVAFHHCGAIIKMSN